MSLWGLIFWFVTLAIIAGLLLVAVTRMVVHGVFAEPVEPETHGDDGGWPVDASGYPTMLPKTMGQHEAYENALDRFFARGGGD